jgi:hypothetical protein
MSDDRHIGPMAQDVEARWPGSTVKVNGFLHLKITDSPFIDWLRREHPAEFAPVARVAIEALLAGHPLHPNERLLEPSSRSDQPARCWPHRQ